MNYLQQLQLQKQIAQEELEKPFKKILFGENKDNYKTIKGTWDIEKISQEVRLSKQTVRKWIKRLTN